MQTQTPPASTGLDAVVLRPGTRIKVTSDDIVNGIGGSPTCCALALAIKRSISDDCYPYVVADWMGIVRGGETLQRFDLPYEVGEWVRAFDELCDYSECESAEDFSAFWNEHNDGEPYEIWPVEPMEFMVP